MKTSVFSKEVKHSIDTINKAYEGSPNMARDVITTTLPCVSREDYEKMHDILEKVKKENCENEICKTTIDNVRTSMGVLREEHERSPAQVEATKQLLGTGSTQIRSEGCIIMSVHDITYGEELNNLFKNMNYLNMEEQKKVDQQSFEITHPLLQDISFAPMMFETASSNDFSIVVIPKEFISLSLEQISDSFYKAYDYLFANHNH